MQRWGLGAFRPTGLLTEASTQAQEPGQTGLSTLSLSLVKTVAHVKVVLEELVLLHFLRLLLRINILMLHRNNYFDYPSIF